MEFRDFLKKFNITADQFKKTNYKWRELQNIKKDYISINDNLNQILDLILNSLKEKNIKYLTGRVKDPDHLLAKIVRKKIDKPKEIITIKNYREKITDLIGVRILHLFKDDWFPIHNFISKKWSLKEKPLCFYREGDFSNEKIRNLKKFIRLEKHKDGYRSMHYIICTKPSKNTQYVEIQVRTIFEEAWSEIDHLIRYPNNLNNKILAAYLFMFNKLAGQADDMATYLNDLKAHLIQNDNTINELKERLRKSKIGRKEKRKFADDLSKLSSELKVYVPKDFTLSKNLNINNNVGHLDIPDNGHLYKLIKDNEGSMFYNADDLNK